jgi:hypothetical protein
MNAKVVMAVTFFLVAAVIDTEGQVRDPCRPGGAECVFAPLSSYLAADFRRVEKHFVWTLGCPVDKVLESVIGEVARLKLAQPGCCSEMIQERLADLAVNGNTPCVRYKAALTSLLFDMPEIFVYEGPVEYATGEELFSAIARRLEVQLLAEELR